MTNDFEGKVVLITGAGKGKGRALAEAFSTRGAFVAVNDVSPINLDELVSKSGGKIKAYVDDVAKKVATQAIINQIEDDFGGIDILINHAAVEPRVGVLEMDEWDWHRVLDVNLTGTFLMMQSAGRVMRAKGSGVIINLITATRHRLALPAPVPQAQVSEVEGSEKEAAYLASMAGLIALTRSASIEFAPHHIHVHAVGTGFTEFQHADPSVPADLIESVLYLCRSDLNGQIVNLEGAMNELQEYRKQLMDNFEASAREFHEACLAVKNPYSPIEEGGWNVHQLAAHTRDVDKLVYGMRARRTLEEDNPQFENFDGDAYMIEHYDAYENLGSMLDGFVLSVSSLVNTLRGPSGQAWTRESRHLIQGGGLTLQTWVERDLGHIREHLESVKKAK